MRLLVKAVGMFVVSACLALAGCAAEEGDGAVEEAAQALIPGYGCATPPQNCPPMYGAPPCWAPNFSAPQFPAPTFAAPQYGPPTFDAPTYDAPMYQRGPDQRNFGAPVYTAPNHPAPSFAGPEYCAPEYKAPTFLAPIYKGPTYVQQGPDMGCPTPPQCTIIVINQDGTRTAVSGDGSGAGYASPATAGQHP
jgi:hypothetical protein